MISGPTTQISYDLNGLKRIHPGLWEETGCLEALVGKGRRSMSGSCVCIFYGEEVNGGGGGVVVLRVLVEMMGPKPTPTPSHHEKCFWSPIKFPSWGA